MQTTTVHIIWQAALTWLLQDRHLVFYQQGASGVNPTIIGGHHPATHMQRPNATATTLAAFLPADRPAVWHCHRRRPPRPSRAAQRALRRGGSIREG